MNIAIVGSRGFKDWQQIMDYVAALPSDTVIISGGANGADIMGETFAKVFGLETKIFYPDWKLGKGAGMIRNQIIVDNADKVIAFMVAGRSNGTKDTIKKTRAANKPVEIFYEIRR